jgi:hypothetical protein
MLNKEESFVSLTRCLCFLQCTHGSLFLVFVVADLFRDDDDVDIGAYEF